MAKAIGVEIRAALKKTTAWGTALECGMGDGRLILPPTLKKERPALVDDSLGLCFPQGADIGEIKVEGDIPAYLRYDSMDLLIALAMGETGGVPVQQGATAAYAQTFKLKDNLDSLFAVFSVNNNVNIDEYTSLKVAGFTLKGEVGKPLQITFHCIAIDRITGSTVNTPATFANVTFFETANRVLYSQGVVRMNSRGDAALAGGDAIYPGSFELSFKRNLRGVYGVASGFNLMDEPTNDGRPEVKLKLDFPRYTAKTYFEDWDADTAKKLDMTFTGGEIENPYNRVFRVQFPNLKYSSVDLPVEQGILKHPLEFNCLATDTAPAGMTGILLPFQVDVINRQSADVLA